MKVAVFTMVYNEAVFLPMWISHYAAQVGRESLFVIDIGSNDGSTDRIDVNCLRLSRAYLDEERRTAYVHHFHASLLSYYDVVIFCDTDEFLVADPERYAGLLDFLRDKPEQIIAPVGLNLIHVVDQEMPLDRDTPVLMARRYAQFDSLYCKPIIGRNAIAWRPGFHSCVNPFVLNKNLYLFHLKAVDLNIFSSELRIKRAAGIDQTSLAKGFGVQMSIEEEEFTKMHFDIDSRMLEKSLKKDFDFTEDLLRYVKSGFKGLGDSRGSIVIIPARFRSSLPALSGKNTIVP